MSVSAQRHMCAFHWSQVTTLLLGQCQPRRPDVVLGPRGRRLGGSAWICLTECGYTHSVACGVADTLCLPVAGHKNQQRPNTRPLARTCCSPCSRYLPALLGFASGLRKSLLTMLGVGRRQFWRSERPSPLTHFSSIW